MGLQELYRWHPIVEGPRRPSRAATVGLAVVVFASISCSTLSSAVGSITGSTQKKEAAEKVAHVQSEVMSFADTYVGVVLESTSRIPAPAAEDQVRLLSFQVRQAGAAYEIASGTNPVANLLDMLILVTATRSMVDAYWAPNVFGEAGQPLAAALAKLEPVIWAHASDLLNAEQQKVLRDFIDGWVAQNPENHDPSSVRIANLSSKPGSASAGLGTPTDILNSVGLTIFGGLDPTLMEVQQGRVLAEKAFYFAKRWPRVLEMQTRLVTLQLTLQPAPSRLLGDMNRVSLAAESVAQTAEQLPGLVDREREAAIRQVFDAMQAQGPQARAVLDDVRRTLDAGTGTANAVHGVLGALDPILAKVSAPSPNDAAPSPRFDINDYSRALEELGASAAKLESLLLVVNQDASKVEALIGDAGREASERGSALVQFAFRRAAALVLLTIGGALVAALVYRWASIRMARSRAG